MTGKKIPLYWNIITISGSCALILFGVSITFFQLQTVLKSHMDNSYRLGQGYFEMANYQMAEKSYRSAIFFERYLVLTDDNSNLPIYYRELARAVMNEYRYEETYTCVMASLDTFARFRPDDAEEIASAYLTAVMACSLTGRDAEELEYAQLAYAYYSGRPEDSQIAARTGAWLGHCRYEAGDYSAGYRFFQENLPVYYDGIHWGVGDEAEVDFALMAYKCAMLCEEKLPGLEHFPSTEQYQRLLYIREKQESDVDGLASQLGWDW